MDFVVAATVGFIIYAGSIRMKIMIRKKIRERGGREIHHIENL